ncbi:hypothetical protein ACSBR1_019043 [Camellia fascicularis]
MASSSRPLTLFSDLNDPSSPGPSTPAPTLSNLPGHSATTPTLLNFHMLSIEQIMAVQSDIEANHFTLKSFERQHKYKDARAEICSLKAENKELKRKTTVMARFGASSYLAFDSQQGVNSLGGPVRTEARSSRVSEAGPARVP